MPVLVPDSPPSTHVRLPAHMQPHQPLALVGIVTP